MNRLLRRAATLSLQAGGPLHFGSGESLDPLAMLLHEGAVWRVDFAEFVRRLRRSPGELLNARSRGVDPLRQCHRFLREHLATARDAAPPGTQPWDASPAVAEAYADYIRGARDDVPHLALQRAGSEAGVVAGAHLRAAMSVAWRAWTREGPLPLKTTDCALVAGRMAARVVVAGVLRTDAPRPMPQARPSQWMLALCPEGGALHAGAVAPVFGREPWDGVLQSVMRRCNAHYRPRLLAQVQALEDSAARAPDSPLAQFVRWSQDALVQTAQDESAFLLQVGGFSGSPAHPGTGKVGSAHRIPVCMEAAGTDPCARVQGSRPMGWLLARVGTAHSLS